MAERFTRAYTLPEGLYIPGAPVLIAAGALLKDNQTGQMLAQLKIKNISAKEIKAATVKLTAFDTAERKLETGAEQQYLDLKVSRDNYFGETVPIVIADANARSYEVAVTEVVFADNTIWNGTDTPWQKQITLTPLSETLTDPELITQYAINLEKEIGLLKCLPQEQEDLWICTCGAINHKEETACHSCESELSTLKATLDIKKLGADKNARLEAAQQKAEAEAKEKAEKAAKAKEKAAKATKKITVSAICAVVIITVGIFAFQAISKSNDYKAAVAALDSKDYASAIDGFTALGDYKDSKEQIKEVLYRQGKDYYEQGKYSIAFTTFSQISDYKDSANIMEGMDQIFKNVFAQRKLNDIFSIHGDSIIAIKNDGTVEATDSSLKSKSFSVENWKNIIAVSAGSGYVVGLKFDGTVVATGENEDGQCNVDNWTDIVAISAGINHTVGLKSDGTVVATGKNNNGQCNVDDWTDVVAISAGSPYYYCYTIGLKADGTMVTTGQNTYDQCNVSNWKDVIAISADGWHTVGLKADGTVVVAGDNEYGQCNVTGWKDIVAISTGNHHTVGLKADGTVVAIGDNDDGQCNVTGWKDIVAISAGTYHTAGLKADGTVVATGIDSGLCNVGSWKNIVAIFTSNQNTVGLKADGTLLITGSDFQSQGNIGDWKDIMVPGK